MYENSSIRCKRKRHTILDWMSSNIDLWNGKRVLTVFTQNIIIIIIIILKSVILFYDLSTDKRYWRKHWVLNHFSCFGSTWMCRANGNSDNTHLMFSIWKFGIFRAFYVPFIYVILLLATTMWMIEKTEKEWQGLEKRGFNPLTYPITLFTQRQYLCIGSSSKQWDIFPKVCTARVSQFHVQWICIVMMKADTHMSTQKKITSTSSPTKSICMRCNAMHTRFWPYAMWFIYFHDSVCAIVIVEKRMLSKREKNHFKMCPKNVRWNQTTNFSLTIVQIICWVNFSIQATCRFWIGALTRERERASETKNYNKNKKKSNT